MYSLNLTKDTSHKMSTYRDKETKKQTNNF